MMQMQADVMMQAVSVAVRKEAKRLVGVLDNR
jgi:hypothetical protein